MLRDTYRPDSRNPESCTVFPPCCWRVCWRWRTPTWTRGEDTGHRFLKTKPEEDIRTLEARRQMIKEFIGTPRCTCRMSCAAVGSKALRRALVLPGLFRSSVDTLVLQAMASGYDSLNGRSLNRRWGWGSDFARSCPAHPGLPRRCVCGHLGRAMMRPRTTTPSLPLAVRDVLRCIDRSVLCWLATVDAQGRPNVYPKEISWPMATAASDRAYRQSGQCARP